MANVRWFKIQSWHIWSGQVSRANAPRSLCGKYSHIGAEIVDDRPGNEKTCENCLRLVAPR